MAHALLDDHWTAVRRLVRVLCAHRLPVTLPGPVVTRLIETALARRARDESPAAYLEEDHLRIESSQ